MSTDAVQRTPPPDLADHRVYHDFWSVYADHEAWEKVFLEVQAEKRAKQKAQS